jgi:hypothetical protein
MNRSGVWPSARRVAAWGVGVGGVAFALGFFGPMILAPDANQGPLLGILITGPLGTLLGLTIGVSREVLGYRTGPLELLARAGLPDIGRVGARPVAVVAGLALGLYGLVGLRAGEGRPAAASVVVAVVLVWYGAVGRVPDWFRR